MRSFDFFYGGGAQARACPAGVKAHEREFLIYLFLSRLYILYLSWSIIFLLFRYVTVTI